MKPNIEWDGYNKGEEFTLFDTEINLLEERQQGNFFLPLQGISIVPLNLTFRKIAHPL